MAKALGRQTAPPPPPVLHADSQCKWIEEGEINLGLPDFPEFPTQFELPPVPPIPRLLPDWGWVQSLMPLQQARPIELHTLQNRALISEVGFSGLVLGLGIGVFAGVALLRRWHRSGQMALEKQTSSEYASARAVNASLPSASGLHFSA